jgi:hypothetical protein
MDLYRFGTEMPAAVKESMTQLTVSIHMPKMVLFVLPLTRGFELVRSYSRRSSAGSFVKGLCLTGHPAYTTVRRNLERHQSLGG